MGLRIAIIGAGPGGLCMGVKLEAAGIDDFVLLERSDCVGGTWRRNTYPGAACDVQSALYSFSFEFKADWTRPYAPQPEILAYMEGLAETYGLLPHWLTQRAGGDAVAVLDDRVPRPHRRPRPRRLRGGALLVGHIRGRCGVIDMTCTDARM